VDNKKFQIGYKETPDNHLFYLRGELDLAVAPQLRAHLEPVLNQTNKGMVLNLKDLSYIDSTGMGIIIFALKVRNENNGVFLVEEIPPKIKRLFDLTGITKFIAGDSRNAKDAEGES
jgi:anti-sigma B factor antagonist